MTFLFISILQIIRLVWYFQVFSSDFTISHSEFIDLTRVAVFSKTISDLDSAVILIMMVAFIKYVMFWFDSVAVMANMLKKSLMVIFGFLTVFFVPQIGFMLSFHYIIGPYEFFYSTKILAFLAMMKAQLGTWTTNTDFGQFISVYFALILIGLFLFWRIVIFYIQTTSIRWEIMEARKLKPTKKRRVRDQKAA